MFFRAFVSWAMLGLASSACVIQPYGLRANDLVAPYVNRKVLLSWKLKYLPGKETIKDQEQASYNIQACAHDTSAGQSCNNVVWTSGTVTSNQSLGILYEGKPVSEMRVYWNVLVVDQSGEQCQRAETTWFEFGLLEETAWEGAEWLAREIPQPVRNNCALFADDPTPLFRATFSLPQGVNVTSARLYITGLGYFNAWVDGAVVEDSLINPAFSLYSARVYYRVFDVTTTIASHSGRHSVAVELGNGYWNPLPLMMWARVNIRDALPHGVPMMKCVIKIRYAQQNGTGGVAVVPSSLANNPRLWRVGNGATLQNSIYLGEVFDMRRHEPDWVQPQFNDSTWKAPLAVDQGVGRLEAMPTPPVRIHENLAAKQIASYFNDTLLILDTSKNHAGVCEYTFNGSAGAVINFRYGELLLPNGSVNCNTSTVGQIKAPNPNMPCQPDLAWQRDKLVLGNGKTTWRPSFSWRGFRYIEVHLPGSPAYPQTAADPKPQIVAAVCSTMRTDVAETRQHFSLSDPKLKRLHQVNMNTWQGNLMSYESDCPHREKFPYALSESEAGVNLYDFSAFYAKRVADFNDAQAPNGGYTETAPYMGIQDHGLGGIAGPVGWATYPTEMMMLLYKYYGNKEILRESFDAMTRYMELLDTNTSAIQNGLGDWQAIEYTGVDFTGLAFQLSSYRVMVNISSILGESEMAEKYTKKAAAIAAKMNSDFLDASGAYTNMKDMDADCTAALYYTSNNANQAEQAARFNGTQTGQSLAFFLRIVPEDMKQKVFDVLLNNVYNAGNITGPPAPYGQGPPKGGPGPHLLTGMFGIKWLLQTLSENGHTDLAYQIQVQETYPSRYWMTQNPYCNATTVWEVWYFSDNIYSHNHPMFSTNEVWFIQSLVGLAPHPSARGMDWILINPRPSVLMAKQAPDLVSSVSTAFETARGTVTISWKLTYSPSGSDWRIEISIPPNVKAVTTLPGPEPAFILGSGNYTYSRTL